VRHPAERIVSCYIDKFVNPVLKGHDFESFVIPHIIAAQRQSGVEPNRDRSIRFSEFMNYIISSPPWKLDAHWRPQAHFVGKLDVKRKTTFIRSDNLDYFASAFKLSFDSRRHNSSVGKKFYAKEGGSGKFENTLPADMDLSRLESYNEFFGSDMLEKVSEYFGADIRLFERAN
jgi:hypothetical protein